jgi:hypothetical protein
MRDPRHANEFFRVVDDVQHAPITDPNAPLVFVAFQFSASRGPRCTDQRIDLADGAGKDIIG